MILQSGTYEDLSSNYKIFSIKELDATFHIQLSPEQFMGYRLYDILEITNLPYKSVVFDNVKYDKTHPWVDIPTENINTKQGNHLYRLCFYKEDNESILSTFFSYSIQDDNPDKPYIYMKDHVITSDASEGKYLE